MNHMRRFTITPTDHHSPS
ncbi:hypothetical protein LINGRAHAP2_LOCUS32142 [Linum grandiflorum]